MPDNLWIEKYRPQTVEDCVLPKRLKDFFQAMVNDGNLQNLLLVGGPGCGKTTAAKAMCNEMGVDVLFINASEQGGIDTLRTQIRSFASKISFADANHKCVILDEADYLNPNSTQPALRSFIEEFSNNCRFILTANFGNRILDPIKSRCTVIDFTLTKEEKQEAILGLNTRLKTILTNEEVTFEKKELAQVIIKYFPDFRKTINELQRCSHTGELIVSALSSITEDALKSVVRSMKNKKFAEIRKWVVENSDIDFNMLIRGLYETMYEWVVPSSIPELVLLLNDYDYRRAFVMDSEIHTVALLTQIMAEIDFKT